MWRIKTQKAMQSVYYAVHSFSHAQNAPQPCCHSTKLKSMTISIKTKVNKSEGSHYVWRIDSQKATKSAHFTVCTCEKLILTCTERTSNMLLLNETQNYDY